MLIMVYLDMMRMGRQAGRVMVMPMGECEYCMVMQLKGTGL